MCKRAKAKAKGPAPEKAARCRRTGPGRPAPGDKVVLVRCQRKSYPCPACGKRGHRRHKYDRYVRSLALGQVVWLHGIPRSTLGDWLRQPPPDSNFILLEQDAANRDADTWTQAIQQASQGMPQKTLL